MIVQNPVNLNKPIFKEISDAAKDFIKKAMTKDPNERFSAEQLLKHEWMLNMNKANDKVLSLEAQRDILTNLASFSKATKFQKTITSILMGLRSQKSDLKTLKIAFNQIDTNNDGTLSKDEI